MPSAARLASLVALVAPLVSSSGCVCPGSPLGHCYHKDATEGASDSDSTQTGSATETTGATEGTSITGMSETETMATTGVEPTTCDNDGIKEEGEACDDGNEVNTDGCLTTCKLADCGDSYVYAGQEECDDGDKNSNDAACTVECKKATCGDNHVQDGVEECDEGVMNADDAACTSVCRAATCGDGFVQLGVEDCEDGNQDDTDECNACKYTYCGDGVEQRPNGLGEVEGCDDGNQVETDDCDQFCKSIPHRVVFVSSALYSGNLGGLAGADGKCTELAKAAGMDGVKFKAWLSDSVTTPASRFDAGFSGVYNLVDGTLVAHGWTELIDGSLAHAIDLDETNNAMPVDTLVWSNTTGVGGLLGGNHCTNWTSASTMINGAYGFSVAVTSAWTNSGNVAACKTANNIYCFQDPA